LSFLFALGWRRGGSSPKDIHFHSLFVLLAVFEKVWDTPFHLGMMNTFDEKITKNSSDSNLFP